MPSTFHNFELNSPGKSTGFVFHQTIGEGKECYFVGQFASDYTDSQVAAEAIFGKVIDSLQQNIQKDGYDNFEEALKSANAEACNWSTDSEPDIIVALLDFNHLYLSQSGKTESYLIRNSTINQISEQSDKSTDLFVNILSGQVTIHDIIILTTDRLLRDLTAKQLVESFAGGDFASNVKTLQEKSSTHCQDHILVSCIGIGINEQSATKNSFLHTVLNAKKKLLPNQIKASPQHTDHDIDVTKSTETPDKNSFSFLSFIGNLKNIMMSFRPSFDKKNPQTNRLIIIATVVLLSLVVGIGFKTISNFESAEEKSLREALAIAREAITQADTLLIQGERQEARNYIDTAQEMAEKVLSSKTKTFRSDAQFLLADIEEKKLTAENAKKVTPTLLADLSTKNDDLYAVNLLRLRGSLFVSDLKQIHKTVRNIVEKGITISEKETIVASSAREDQNTLLFLTNSPRIIEYQEGIITPMNTDDATWKSGIDIDTYGRYAYILDPINNQIWKYERRSSNYSPAIPYNQGADLSRAVSLSIDGAIYVLNDDGTITKLFRGAPNAYEFKDIPFVGFSGQKIRLFTNSELDFLYVLDPDNQRILVFVKGDRYATYKKQIVFSLEGAVDFIIDDAGQRVSILTKDKIYEFSL